MSPFLAFLIVIVLLGTVPIFVLLFQFLAVGAHGLHNHYRKCKDYTPRVAIMIPAWNEEFVIGDTLLNLLEMDYPLEKLKIYVVDDNSTDQTPVIIKTIADKHPLNVFHIRRLKGGEGKASTLNAGLKVALADDWAQAVMIIDADILFEATALRRMTRHLADPEIGAVTAYIKVEQPKGNILTRYIASEYILAQAAARRAQNALDVLACLAGGAQLHSRENIDAVGGQINTSTLAEDTYTTFLTQINHRKAIFEGNAVVLAEEPDDLISFWKQRLRWGRGNVQVSWAFRDVWFNPKFGNLGSIYFAFIWFATIIMPFCLITSSISLTLLYFIAENTNWNMLRVFYFLSVVPYVFCILLSLDVDPRTMKKAWFALLLFPGMISLIIMAIVVVPNYYQWLLIQWTGNNAFFWMDVTLIFMQLWLSLCMLASWGVYRLAKLGVSKPIINFLITIVGYGPLLCTITLVACIKELQRSSVVWDKTEKRREFKDKVHLQKKPYNYATVLKKDKRKEYKIFLYEIVIVAIVITLAVIRQQSEW